MTELERLELDVAAIEAKLADPVYAERTPRERLDEEREFRNELCARLETLRELARRAPPIAGGLPPDGVGRWAPLPLFDKPPSEDTSDLPPPSLELVEIEPDFAAISRQVAALIRSSGAKVVTLKQLAHRWKRHPATFRLVIAALQTIRASGTANVLRPKPTPIVAREISLPPTEWLTRATELPDEFDGLTSTQRRILRVMRTIAPPGHSFVRLNAIVAELDQLELPQVERALISLGHPSLRRLPLIEMQGFSGRFTPPDTHLTGARLTPIAIEVLDEALALPLLLVNGAEGVNACIPPHHPTELIKTCLYLMENRAARRADLARFIEGPDLPEGGWLSDSGVEGLWQTGTGRFVGHARLQIELDDETSRTRIVITDFPWPMRASVVRAAILDMKLDGVSGILDHSNSSGGRLIVELEHLAFSGPVRDAIEQSLVCQQSFETEFRVTGVPHQRRLPLADLLLAFIEHRREVAVKKLDRVVNQARVRAQGAEAVCLAILLLEPVLKVMRDADDDPQAIVGLMNFMEPAHRAAQKSLPFPASHDYAKGFTEAQARHLLTVRKLASRRMEHATQDWAALLSARDEAVMSLSDRQAILEVVRQEFRAALVRFEEPRRTQLSHW